MLHVNRNRVGVGNRECVPSIDACPNTNLTITSK
jgi:hypothetical protein